MCARLVLGLEVVENKELRRELRQLQPGVVASDTLETITPVSVSEERPQRGRKLGLLGLEKGGWYQPGLSQLFYR